MTAEARRGLAVVLLLALSPGLAGLGVAAQLPRSQPVDRARPGVVEEWLSRLVSAEDLLRDGEHKKARRSINDVLEEVSDRVQGGDSVGTLLANAVLLRAVAEAGLGRQEEALWDWYASRALDPSIESRDLSSFGPAAAILERERESPRGISLRQPPSTPVRPIRQPPIDYPAGMYSACVEGTAVVVVIVGLDGRPAAPRVVAAPSGAMMAFASLEHVRRWRFRPAQRDGRSVEATYSIAVNFRVPDCKNVFAVAAPEDEDRQRPIVTLPPATSADLPVRLTIERIDPSPESPMTNPRMLRILVRYEVPEALLARGEVLLLPQFAQRGTDDTFLVQEPGARTHLTESSGTTTLYYSMKDIWDRRLARPVRLWMHAVLADPSGAMETVGIAGPVVYATD